MVYSPTFYGISKAHNQFIVIVTFYFNEIHTFKFDPESAAERLHDENYREISSKESLPDVDLLAFASDEDIGLGCQPFFEKKKKIENKIKEKKRWGTDV